MYKATNENIDIIFWKLARGQTYSGIANDLGIHRQTVKKIVDSNTYQARVEKLEFFLMGTRLSDERKLKNAIILKAMSMSHLDKDDVLKTAQQLARDYYSEPHQHLFVEMEDVDRFCADFLIIF